MTNYTLRFRSCGLSRGDKDFALITHKALPLTHSGRFSPENPEQRVPLSLQFPLMGYTPKNPVRL